MKTSVKEILQQLPDKAGFKIARNAMSRTVTQSELGRDQMQILEWLRPYARPGTRPERQSDTLAENNAEVDGLGDECGLRGKSGHVVMQIDHLAGGVETAVGLVERQP